MFYYFARRSGCQVLWWVCLSVGLSVCPVSIREDISGTTHDLYQILCMLSMSVAWSSDMFTIGCIACHREWVSSPLQMHYRPGRGMGVQS